MSPSAETSKTTVRPSVKENNPTALELQSKDLPYQGRGLHRHRERDHLRHELGRVRERITEVEEEWFDLNQLYNAVVQERDSLRIEVKRLRIVKP